jgi:hypothetical protein
VRGLSKGWSNIEGFEHREDITSDEV